MVSLGIGANILRMADIQAWKVEDNSGGDRRCKLEPSLVFADAPFTEIPLDRLCLCIGRDRIRYYGEQAIVTSYSRPLTGPILSSHTRRTSTPSTRPRCTRFVS